MPVVKIEEQNGIEYLTFNCKGCDWPHTIPVSGEYAWGFNGSLDKPTLTPSLLNQSTWGKNKEKRVCHSFVRDGQIQYLNDCTHELVGQTISLQELKNGERK